MIAVDIGNNRIKLGCFGGAAAGILPEPGRTLALGADADQIKRLGVWLGESPPHGLSWWIGSVNRPAATRLVDWLRHNRPDDAITLLAADDLPLRVALERPDMVGIDRLLDALAANRLRQPASPAVVVDIGSAITVDLLSANGEFCGGAILPGIEMSARALHAFTDLLPRVAVSDLEVAPPVLGRSTVPAIRSGLFWGAVGAIRQLVERLTDGSQGDAQTFVTGGAGPSVAELLGPPAVHVPHLTLSGIALAAIASSGAPP